MKKILVIGSGGAGKSTFAKRLGDALKIDVIHLDRLYWKPNWMETEKTEWRETVEKVASRESWIMDGNYSGTLETRIRACDTIIFLDIPRRICLYRVLKRALLYRGRTRPDMGEGCVEKVDLAFMKWVWGYPYHSRPSILAQMERFAEKTRVVLRSAREADAFLRSQMIRLKKI